MALFIRHRDDGGGGGHVDTAYRRQLAELAYHRRATQLLADDYCFRIVFVSDRRLFRGLSLPYCWLVTACHRLPSFYTV